MSDNTTKDPYSAFRLNLEQQKKRAKELLRAAKASDAFARKRLLHTLGSLPDDTHALQLASAQHCIARELRFANWAALKQHITQMEQQRLQLEQTTEVLDGDCRTMHIRCGHDIQHTLKQAGFHGNFNLHINPYLQGPVTTAANWLEQRARYICDQFGPYMNLAYETVLADCHDEEKRLASASRGDYERVVLWLEHDRYDQFVLIRCLAWFAEHGAPARLELVGPNDFPGSHRFRGLGQLPPEALRLLWQRRTAISPAQIKFGHEVWQLFRAANPEPLAKLVRTGTPLLPDLAAALHRHLQELPSPHSGLGLTQQLLLQTLADKGPMRAGRLVGLLILEVDPLSTGDTSYDQILREMAQIPTPLVLREGNHSYSEWHLDTLTITDQGRAVLAGHVNGLNTGLPQRWVGGVCIAGDRINWHWDQIAQKAILQPERNAWHE